MATKDNETRQVEALEKIANDMGEVRVQLIHLNQNITAIIRQMNSPLRR